ncbi:MAG: hypothetical protein WBP03_01950 [Candidatus Saccharimonadales bacterium]
MRLVHVPSAQKTKTNSRKFPKRTGILATIVCVCALNYLRPLPPAKITLSLPPLPQPQAVQLAWPDFGQAALTADGYDILASHGAKTPLATASIAKVITALCVLEKYPLQPGESGPFIVMTADDVEAYHEQIEKNGSLLPVYAGERMSEYEALEALLVPSANNIADTTARWAFGSDEAYRDYANSWLVQHGLYQTQVGSDASGLDPSTRSTAEDLARLGKIAQKNPVIMEIAGRKNVDFTYAGRYANYNTALGTAGITGLKTGNNDENPGGLLFTADVPLDRGVVHLSGAVIGGVSLPDAIHASEELVRSAATGFETIKYAQADQTVGNLGTAWGASTPIITHDSLEIWRWKQSDLERRSSVRKTNGLEAGAVGTLELKSDSTRVATKLVIEKPVKDPSFWWRLTRLH